MPGNITVAVRYCGGCNPYYDAAEATRKLQQLAGWDLCRWESGNLPDICVLVKQCPSDCFADAGEMAQYATFLLEREGDIPQVAGLLVEKIRELEGCRQQKRG